MKAIEEHDSICAACRYHTVCHPRRFDEEIARTCNGRNSELLKYFVPLVLNFRLKKTS